MVTVEEEETKIAENQLEQPQNSVQLNLNARKEKLAPLQSE